MHPLKSNKNKSDTSKAQSSDKRKSSPLFGQPQSHQSNLNNILYLQRTIGNQATQRLINRSASQKTTRKKVIQRSDSMSFQEALSFWQEMERGDVEEDAPSENQVSEADAPSENQVSEADVPSENQVSEADVPKAKTGVGTYHEKDNKDDWKNPETAESLGGDDTSFFSKELGDFFKEKEKDKYEEGTGFSQATWGKDNRGRGQVLPVKYIDDEDERASYELKFDKGKELFFWRGEPVDTTKMKREISAHGTGGAARMIFVMTTSGQVYIADEGAETRSANDENDEQQWRFNHSTLVAGEPIASAGEIWFEDGKLKGVSDKSGHYQPTMEYTKQILKHFARSGINLDDVIVELMGKDDPLPATELIKDIPEDVEEEIEQLLEEAGEYKESNEWVKAAELYERIFEMSQLRVTKETIGYVWAMATAKADDKLTRMKYLIKAQNWGRTDVDEAISEAVEDSTTELFENGDFSNHKSKGFGTIISDIKNLIKLAPQSVNVIALTIVECVDELWDDQSILNIEDRLEYAEKLEKLYKFAQGLDSDSLSESVEYEDLIEWISETNEELGYEDEEEKGKDKENGDGKDKENSDGKDKENGDGKDKENSDGEMNYSSDDEVDYSLYSPVNYDSDDE